MKIMRWLFDRTPTEADPPPMIALTAAAKTQMADQISVNAEDATEIASDPATDITRYILEPYFSMIEYTDAVGNFSRRRVTMRHVDDNGHTQMLCAYCHERRALRHFRLDRISCLISQDGEVDDAHPWFAEILAISETRFIARKQGSVRKPPPPTVSTYTKLRREIAPALTLLIAAARSDDILHPKEIDRILRFAEDEAILLRDAGELPGNPDAEAFDKLERTIRRLRPTREDLVNAFEAVAARDLVRQRHLAHALAETAAADGRVDEIESALIEDLRGIGARRHGFGWDE